MLQVRLLPLIMITLIIASQCLSARKESEKDLTSSGIITVQKANIREKPSTASDSPILIQLGFEDEFKIIEETRGESVNNSEQWFKILIEDLDLKGYIHGSLFQSKKDYLNFVKQVNFKCKVKGSNVRLRSGAKISASEIAMLGFKDAVIVREMLTGDPVDSNPYWCKVDVIERNDAQGREYSGFVHSSLIDLDNITTRFNNAVSEGDLETVKLIQKFGYNINIRDSYGQTALSWAIIRKQDAIATYLLDQGATVNIADFQYGITPLMRAAENGSDAILTKILSTGADINTKDSYGQNALVYSIFGNCKACAKILLDKGIDKSEKVLRGEYKDLSPAEIAKKLSSSVAENL